MKSMLFVKVCVITIAIAGMSISCTKEGAVGPQGEQGELGAKGDKGDRGETGARGANGAKGDKGDRGETGARGATGAKGDKGDTGATGAQGPVGPRGATGSQGPKGDPGSANVIYSGWITLPSTPSVTSYEIAAPKLTQAIFDRGQIAVYMRVDNHGTYEVVQLGEGWLSSATYKIGYRARVGSLVLTSENTSLNGYSYRYVLIPGGISAQANVNTANYQAVKQAYGIID